ncbi:MAG: hypothetical protein JWM21_851 [Acidobacteria bacterium]|nr:hypothetical protein [Acidobacteriota bacterium]
MATRTKVMLIQQIAVVSEAAGISLADLSPVSAALQTGDSDLIPLWGLQATVDCFAGIENVPSGYWKVIITDHLQPSKGGRHREDANGQPFALVRAKAGWPISASYEVVELLVDPFGRRLVSKPSHCYSKAAWTFW